MELKLKEVLAKIAQETKIDDLEDLIEDVTEEHDRNLQLERYEQYYYGLQHASKQTNYDGRKALKDLDFINYAMSGTRETPTNGVPWYLKNPYISKQLPKAIVDKLTAMLFGEMFCPSIEAKDPNGQDFVNELIKQTKWFSQMSAARSLAGAEGSVAIGVGLLNNRPIIEIANAKHIIPFFEDDNSDYGKLTGLVFSYHRMKSGEDELELTIRIVTDTYDIILCKEEDEEEWEYKVATHNLGFVPWVWIKNSAAVGDIDGCSDFHGQLRNFDAIDDLLTNSFIGVKTNCDPTLVFKTKNPEEAKKGLGTGSNTALVMEPDEDVDILELKGTGSEAAIKLFDKLTDSILQDCRVVLDEGQASGRTATELTKRMQAMQENIEEKRRQFGQKMEDLFEMLLSICRSNFKALPDHLRSLKMPIRDDVDIRWPSLVVPTVQEKQLASQTYLSLVNAKLISKQSARKALAALGIIDDAEKEKELIDGERAESADQMSEVSEAASLSEIPMSSEPRDQMSEMQGDLSIGNES